MNTLDHNTDHSDKDTKQTILDATVKLIKEDGFHCATLRKIAAKAKTNLALINYYYGSKENLMGDAVRVLVSTFDDAFMALEDDALPPKERLKLFFIRYIENIGQYPGLARQIFDQGPQIMCSQLEYDRYCKIMKIQKMHKALQEISKEEEAEKLHLMMLQLYGAIVIPAVMMTSLSGKEGNSLPVFDLPPIGEQIDRLFEHYFNKYNL